MPKSKKKMMISKLFMKNKLMRMEVDTATVKSGTVLLESGPTLMLMVLTDVTTEFSVTQSEELEKLATAKYPLNTTILFPPKQRLV